jgi:transposase
MKWLPNETLFSVCSRYHLFRGNLFPSTTCLELFNSRRNGSQHDFPSNLKEFKKNVGDNLGDVESIVRHHTILPFFGPFQKVDLIQRMLLAVQEPRASTLKSELGLLASRCGAEHPLRACADCMLLDWAQHGVAYWHLAHQLPGVLLCPQHLVLLQECAQKRKWSGRFSWVLPGDADLIGREPLASEPYAPTTLAKLADASIQLAAVGLDITLDRVIVRDIYVAHARDVADSGKIEDLIEPFLKFLQPVTSMRSIQYFPNSYETVRSLLQQLLRNPRGHIHPLKHLLLIIWFFENFRDFLNEYSHRVDQAQLQSPTLSASKALSTHTKVAEGSQFLYQPKGPLRPKRLKPEVRSKLLNTLAEGHAKAKICKRFSLSISTINKLLRAEPQAQRAWENARKRKELTSRRQAWLAITLRRPGLSTKTLRTHASKHYAWLYRNDKDWLFSQTISLSKPVRGNHSNTDWEERDFNLEQQVRTTLKTVFGTDQGLSLLPRQLYALVPSLHSALQQSGRYTVTRGLVESITAGH